MLLWLPETGLNGTLLIAIAHLFAVKSQRSDRTVRILVEYIFVDEAPPVDSTELVTSAISFGSHNTSDDSLHLRRDMISVEMKMCLDSAVQGWSKPLLA